jgi:hypothetical protein
MSNAARIDDKQMDVRRLTKLIVPLCRNAHEKAMRASSPQAWQATSKERARELEFEHTRAAVLFYRSR